MQGDQSSLRVHSNGIKKIRIGVFHLNWLNTWLIGLGATARGYQAMVVLRTNTDAGAVRLLLKKKGI